MYNQFKGKWMPEAICYYFWFADRYPEFLIKDAPFNEKIACAFFEGEFSSPVDPSLMSDLIKSMYNAELQLIV